MSTDAWLLRHSAVVDEAAPLDGGWRLPAPGKQALTSRIMGRSPDERDAQEAEARAIAFLTSPVQCDQRDAGRGAAAADEVFQLHLVAQRGVADGATTLPHLAAIQHSFGHHDVGGVRAHVGGAAAEAAGAIGAAAYATGDDVAFATTPDLRQAAHEAAHVVQQRGGVRLDGGVGRAGDPYERHADAVADLVVRGASAEALLDTMAHRGGAGGPAVQREDRDGDGVDDAPSTEAWPRGPDGRLTEAAVTLLRQRTIDATRAGSHGARGTLSEDDAGSFEGVRGWPDARINRALRLLADLDHGTDTTSRGARVRGRRGATDRPVLAWDTHLDDLGLPDRTREADRAGEYQNMLEFVDRLDGLSAATLGADYNPEYGTGGMDGMPTVRIAGASVGVHPRALYLAAAAQVGMDTRADRAEGGGHFVPAGGFRTLLRDVSDMAHRLGTEAAPRRGRHRGDPARRDRSAALANGGQIYGVLRGELDLALRVLEDQAHGTDTVTGYHHDEHREPALRDFLVGRAAQIRALPASASDEDAGAAARELVAVLEGLPGAATRRHGFGSIDPHGTEHAMGVAVDIYNGAGTGGSMTNFAPPAEYWPFIHRLIARHGGGDTGVPTTLRADSWSDLDATGDQATAARGIATLVRLHGTAEADAIAAEAAPDPAAAAADARTSRHFTQLRQRARNALRNRRNALARAGRSRGLDWTMPDDVQRELASIDADMAVLDATSHADLVMMIQRHYTALLALENHEDADGTVGPPPPEPTPRHGRHPRRPPPDPLASVGPDDASGTNFDLSRLATDLEAMGTEVDAAVTRHDTMDLTELVRDRAFRRWLTTVSDADRPMYDQPTTMVEAFNDVEGTHFYGGHHWEVTPLSESAGGHSLLEDGTTGGTTDYRTTLDRDMARREPDIVERILDIMAESDGGRTALFGTAQLVPPPAAGGGGGASGAPSASGAGMSTVDGTSDVAPSASAPPSASATASAAVPDGAAPAGADPILRAAIAHRLGAADPVLARVHARVVAPFEGATGDGGRLLRELRDRGFYVMPVAE